MPRILKIIAKIIFMLLALVNVSLFVLVFSPSNLSIAMSYKDLELIKVESIPKDVLNFFHKNEIILETAQKTKKNFVASIAMGVIKVQQRFFMNEDEALALDLTRLEFAPKIIGLEAGAEYYYQKSLSQLSEDEWLTLINLYLSFRNQ